MTSDIVYNLNHLIVKVWCTILNTVCWLSIVLYCIKTKYHQKQCKLYSDERITDLVLGQSKL